MKAISLCISGFFFAVMGLLIYQEYKKSEFFNWNVFYVGICSIVGLFYLSAKPLIPGKTYQMTSNGLVEVLPSTPLQPMP